MCSFISKSGSFLRNRFSGNSLAVIRKEIESLQEQLKNIKSSPPSEEFWMSWYLDYQKRLSTIHITRLRKMRLIPTELVSHKPVEKTYTSALEPLIKNDTIPLKDIVLPYVPDVEAMFYILCITDSLLSYILDGIGEELFLSIFPPYAEGPYEYNSVRLKKGDIVIDAGANIGEFSALAGVRGCKAYAFEPMPGIIDMYLSKTAELNPNITICPYALSDKRGELIFDDCSDNSLGSSSYVIKRTSSSQIKVQAIDLDSYAHENNLPSVDFLKADIEGAERYMLAGAKNVLKEFQPKISICTYHLPDDPKVLRELILDANPNYIIEEKFKKMYAYVPGRS